MADIFEEELEFTGRDGTQIRSFMAGPKDSDPHPAIIVIQEIWGLTPFIRDVCRLLSREGYYTIGPHLYSKKGIVELLTEENIMDTMRPLWSISAEDRRKQETLDNMISKMNETQRKVAQILMKERGSLEKDLLAYIEDAYDFIKKKRKVSTIGVVGFCMGGGLSFKISTMIPFDATVVFYGANPSPIESLSNIKGEVLGIYAGEDSGINEGLPDLLSGVVKHHVKFQLNIYPGSQHAFFNHNSMSYNKGASELASQQMLSFFSRTLVK